MKTKVIFFLLLSITFSCKQKNNTEKELEQNNQKEAINYFSLIIEATIKSDDTFTLFYLENDEKNISRKNSVSIKVQGSDALQNLKFELTKDVLPTRLILRLGGKEPKEQLVKFNMIELGYRNHKISIEKEKIFQFFNPNKFIDYDQVNFTASPKEIEGEYMPNLFSRVVLENKIDTIFF